MGKYQLSYAETKLVLYIWRRRALFPDWEFSWREQHYHDRLIDEPHLANKFPDDGICPQGLILRARDRNYPLHPSINQGVLAPVTQAGVSPLTRDALLPAQAGSSLSIGPPSESSAAMDMSDAESEYGGSEAMDISDDDGANAGTIVQISQAQDDWRAREAAQSDDDAWDGAFDDATSVEDYEEDGSRQQSASASSNDEPSQHGDADEHVDEPTQDSDDDYFEVMAPRRRLWLDTSDDIMGSYDFVIVIGRASGGCNLDRIDDIARQCRERFNAWCCIFGQDRSKFTDVDLTLPLQQYRGISEELPAVAHYVVAERPSTNEIFPLSNYRYNGKTCRPQKNDKAICRILQHLNEQGGKRVLLLQAGIDGSSSDIETWKTLRDRYPRTKFRLTVAVHPGVEPNDIRPHYTLRLGIRWGHFDCQALAQVPQDASPYEIWKHQAFLDASKEINDWKLSGAIPGHKPVSIRRHRNGLHYRQTVIKCENCGATSSEPRWYRGVQPHTLRCQSCHSEPVNRKRKRPVEEIDTDENHLVCYHPGCGRTFASRVHLLRHERTHSGEKPYACDQCSKAFARSSDLTQHMRTHTGEKPYACDECPQAFAQRAMLNVHMRTHTGEQPYACDECPEVFTRRGTLTMHKRTHTGEKPYACDQCSKAFTSSSCLTRHKKTHTRA